MRDLYINLWTKTSPEYNAIHFFFLGGGGGDNKVSTSINLK